MKKAGSGFALIAAVLGAASLFTACESTDAGRSDVSGNAYYGTGFVDPWYYGDLYYPPEDAVRPPPDRPDDSPRPVHPIANPPPAIATPRPMPSIPATPRPALRR
jgi:hypothetical protein